MMPSARKISCRSPADGNSLFTTGCIFGDSTDAFGRGIVVPKPDSFGEPVLVARLRRSLCARVRSTDIDRLPEMLWIQRISPPIGALQLTALQFATPRRSHCRREIPRWSPPIDARLDPDRNSTRIQAGATSELPYRHPQER
jgi:hypothetical protein